MAFRWNLAIVTLATSTVHDYCFSIRWRKPFQCTASSIGTSTDVQCGSDDGWCTMWVSGNDSQCLITSDHSGSVVYQHSRWLQLCSQGFNKTVKFWSFNIQLFKVLPPLAMLTLSMTLSVLMQKRIHTWKWQHNLWSNNFSFYPIVSMLEVLLTNGTQLCVCAYPTTFTQSLM